MEAISVSETPVSFFTRLQYTMSQKTGVEIRSSNNPELNLKFYVTNQTDENFGKNLQELASDLIRPLS